MTASGRTIVFVIRVLAGLALCGSTRAADDAFQATIEAISSATWAKMQGSAWTPGCPVGSGDLVLLRLRYWGFDGVAHAGRLVIHRQLAAETVVIFRELFAARFAIARMEPYEDFAVGGYADADDTVGFYCRPDQGDPSKFGMHSYGYAIDINPRENPYRDAKSGWWPRGSAANGSREREVPGVITTRSAAFAIFTRYGWLWGGLFRGEPDYMHFEKATFGAHPNPTEAPYLVEGLHYQGK